MAFVDGGTDYFYGKVVPQRPYATLELCRWVVANAVHQDIGPNGRLRYWAVVPQLGGKIVRVVLEDESTAHNCFFDRSFKLARKGVVR